MPHHHPRLHPKAVALWRYERIEEPLGVRSPDVRGPIVRALSRTPVVWPSGVTRRISLATLYRWIALYVVGGLIALRPARRKDAGKPKAKLPADVVEKAFALLGDDPDLSFTFLLALLKADPDLDLQRRKIVVSRSTLQHRLGQHPGYLRLKRGRKLQRQRRRFVGRYFHDIWHLDAKGPVTVRLKSGKSIEVHILTVLEGLSRAVLATHVALTPDLCAAVRVFRLAALRWGLPDRIYADRASIFDSVAFRGGLAQLGVHRIFVRSRNPEANGKIEAFHRVLGRWFTKRLPRQEILDLEHLQQLLEVAFVEALYQDHHHRGLRNTPRQELGDQVSRRQVAAARLVDAFREERELKAHRKTGEVDLPSGTWLVPDDLRGQRLTFLIDPEPHIAPLLVEPGTLRHLPLKRAAIRAGDSTQEAPVARWGKGPLQALYDAWQGKVRPVAEPGFGLPEMFQMLGDTAGRVVPRSDAEAALIQRVYRSLGPLPRQASEDAFRFIRKALGPGRPLEAYLDALSQRVRAVPKTERRPSR
jgi:putative transposase